MKASFITVLFLFFTAFNFAQSQAEDNGWTIMHYAVGSNSSEVDLLNDVGEMIRGKNSSGYNFITLIDRIEGYSNDSTTLGENFTDTRLYKIDANTYEELDGKSILPQIKIDESVEVNMADAHLLKQFIKYCKTYYPAKHYMLVLRSHGSGLAMCPDAESGTRDQIYTGEISAVLSNEESVDILGLDVCSMAGLENLYEWRPGTNYFSADFVIASAPVSGAWAYDHILKRLQTNEGLNPDQDSNYFSAGNEKNLNPNKMTPLEFSTLIMEEIHDNQAWSSWGLFDNRHIDDAKSNIDELAQLLAHEDKSVLLDIIQNTLGYYYSGSNDVEASQISFPYVDAYHFYKQLSNNSQVKEATRLKAKAVCYVIDKIVVHSFYGRGFLPETNNFSKGKSGIYQIIPLGKNIYSKTGRTFWAHSNWFHPNDKTKDDNSYGLYDWCSNGAISGNKIVDNFYEFLDYLFDDSNSEEGGVNDYQW